MENFWYTLTMNPKPFDNLATVTELIDLYKNNYWGLTKLATHYNVHHTVIKKTLLYWRVSLRGYNDRNQFVQTEINAKSDKYAYVTEEVINSGHSYREICKKQGIKVTKSL